ncbi:MAG: LysM peptidoglycan-binding domain-containing protein, partial [Planctomycetia bacterium]
GVTPPAALPKLPPAASVLPKKTAAKKEAAVDLEKSTKAEKPNPALTTIVPDGFAKLAAAAEAAEIKPEPAAEEAPHPLDLDEKPAAERVESDGRTLIPRAVAPAPPGKPVHPFFQRYLERREYFVRPGDTLENIAHRLYQDPSMAEVLWKLNAESLPAPEDLQPGQILRLP